MGCITCALEACPPGVQALAIIGAIICYLLIGCFVTACAASFKNKSFKEMFTNGDGLLITCLWPVAILMLVFFWIARVIILPFTAAEKCDVRKAKEELQDQITELQEAQIAALPVVKPTRVKGLFLPGDLITGVPGNPDEYKNLTEDCTCKVLSCSDKGNMKIILVNHNDLDILSEKHGKEFKAPARNFVLISTANSKKKKGNSKAKAKSKVKKK